MIEKVSLTHLLVKVERSSEDGDSEEDLDVVQNAEVVRLGPCLDESDKPAGGPTVHSEPTPLELHSVEAIQKEDLVRHKEHHGDDCDVMFRPVFLRP